MIAKAPGKLVVWGEYAVLAGAPAAVMAVDRCATVDLQPETEGIRFCAQGLLAPGLYKHTPGFSGAAVCSLAEAVLRHWGYDQFDRPMRCRIDTRPFYADGVKLGLGSSAAVCVALYVALARLHERTPDVGEAMAIHRAWQGGRGSGLDVACAWQGGVIRFQEGRSTAWSWPDHLQTQVIWTGRAAATGNQLSNFARWRESADPGPLKRLADCSAALFADPVTLAGLRAYTSALQALDQAAGLNIFSQEHQRLATIAARHDLVYKPCGAGGGDIGIAISDDAGALQVFRDAASAHYVPLATEIATDGVQISD